MKEREPNSTCESRLDLRFEKAYDEIQQRLGRTEEKFEYRRYEEMIVMFWKVIEAVDYCLQP